MAIKIFTQHLILLELNQIELELALYGLERLEKQLDLHVTRDVMSDSVLCAIETRLEKLNTAETNQKTWLTYWLMVIPEQKICVGLIGFNGRPDESGEVEIGFALDPSFQNLGFATEATSAMIQWAFLEPACYSVAARDTRKNNLASNQVLAKVGMHVYYASEDSLYWRIDKSSTHKKYIPDETIELLSPTLGFLL